MPRHYDKKTEILNPRNIGGARRLLSGGPKAWDAALAHGLRGGSDEERKGYRSVGSSAEPRKRR